VKTVEELKLKIEELKDYQRDKVYEILLDFLSNNDINLQSLLQGEMICRCCGSVKLVKNGHFKAIQRYKCQESGKPVM